jgi:hypothetical protein
MGKKLFRVRYFVGLNIAGIALFLYFASKIWAPPGDQGLMGGPGDPLVWGFTAAPVLLLCVLINILWISLLVVGLIRGTSWRPIVIWMLVFVAWYGAMRLDVYRSYNGSCFEQISGGKPCPTG